MQCRKFSRHVNSLNEVKSNCTFMLLANYTPDHDCVLLRYTLCRKNKHELSHIMLNFSMVEITKYIIATDEQYHVLCLQSTKV